MFFFKQKTAYEMRISDWSSDVCSSYLSVISDYFPREKRARAMSVLFLAPPLGILIGAGGGALIAQHYGWRVALLSAAAPGLLLALLLSLFISEPKRGSPDAVGDSEDVP